MEQYWDCSLCRIENKAQALRCRTCSGKLKGRERLLFELSRRLRLRREGAVLSSLAAGLGQIYGRRWLTGIFLGMLIPLAMGLIAVTWNGFTYGHGFVIMAALFVLIVAALDAYLGPGKKFAPCQKTCPAGIDIPDYLQLCLDEQWEQGYSLIRTRIPLVGVIGRVCPRPCEIQCLRGIDGEPISINGCKRFLADRHREKRRQVTAAGRRQVVLGGGQISVGVVGSGPAGIACAYFLNTLGVSVTVYEADEHLGGRLATTIPDFRLPPYILKEEIEDVRDLGVSFAARSPVGPAGVAVSELLGQHAALFLAIGAQHSVSLAIPGAEDLDDFQDFLRRVKLGGGRTVGSRVAVVGGGNAAMDVCRTALRSGAKDVHLFYRRTRDEMPARDDEVEEAMREGVQFHFLSDPVRVERADGTARQLTIRTMRLGEADASGRPRPVPVAGSDWQIEVDHVVPALGQSVGGGVLDDPFLQPLRREPDGRVWVDPETCRTSIPLVYAGGDAVSGPATAVQAMGHGRRAALGIYGDVAGAAVPRIRLEDRRLRHPFRGHRETPQAKIREDMPKLTLLARSENFREVEEGFSEPGACREAGRCLQCHREL